MRLVLMGGVVTLVMRLVECRVEMNVERGVRGFAWFLEVASIMRLLKVISVVVLFLALTVREGRAQYDIDQFFIRGQMALNGGDYLQAINNFNVLIRIDGSLYEAYFFRGMAKYNLGDFAGAEKDFDRALELNPVYTLAYHYRAITLSRVGRYDEALRDLDYAVELRPDYYGLYYSRGVTYFLSQQFEKAVGDFNRFIIHEPKEPGAYLNRGASYLFLKDTTKALEDYNKAIQLDYNDPEGFIRRSAIYYAQHRLKDALEDLDHAVSLDSTNTLAYFNRALIRYEMKDVKGTLADFDRVLSLEPGNSLTLYNRALILSQTGDYYRALQDYDRVLDINPENVLAYYNRSILFVEMGRFRDAVEDLSRAIDLYPDFANAYMSRSYVRNQMGDYASAKKDYETAQVKIAQYRSMTADSTGRAAFADTTRKYNRLIALDSDFARSDFNDALLQNRNVDIDLKPLYRFVVSGEHVRNEMPELLTVRYEDKAVEEFEESLPLEVELSCRPAYVASVDNSRLMEAVDREADRTGDDMVLFAKALMESMGRQFNAAMSCYDEAIAKSPSQVFYYINRGALRSEMIDFISSIGNNVQVLTLDEAGTAKARVGDGAVRSYDYSEAINDMLTASKLYPQFPYTYYNLGNLYCLSNDMPKAIIQYTKALDLFPGLAEAYYNRGLVLIYMQDREKGCLDMSKAGELGVEEAYSVIAKFCDQE